MEGIFVPLSFFLALFAILYVYWTNRTRVRLALIEKGVDASIFKGNPQISRANLLKWGIFLVGLSVGVITGYALSNAINEVAAYFTMILFCGGASLIVAYWVSSKIAA
jgi:hypothetical protein